MTTQIKAALGRRRADICHRVLAAVEAGERPVVACRRIAAQMEVAVSSIELWFSRIEGLDEAEWAAALTTTSGQRARPVPELQWSTMVERLVAGDSAAVAAETAIRVCKKAGIRPVSRSSVFRRLIHLAQREADARIQGERT
jgi:hypothetical protein